MCVCVCVCVRAWDVEAQGAQPGLDVCSTPPPCNVNMNIYMFGGGGFACVCVRVCVHVWGVCVVVCWRAYLAT